MFRKNNKKIKRKKNQPRLISYGNFILPPVVPGAEVENLCRRIDDFYSKYPKQHKKQKASDLIKGAFYAMRIECRSNTDWMSQAANSARDVLYPLFSERISSNNLIKLFKKYAVNKNNNHNVQNRDFINTFNNLDVIYKRLSDLTHHGTDLKGFSLKQFSDFSENDFENLIGDFTLVLERAFSLQQIYIHTIIDIIFRKNKRSKELINDLKLILKVNSDARHYFYSKADEHWLTWIWEKGFLKVLEEKAEDTSQYSYRTPEIGYLLRMTDKRPVLVIKIISSIKFSEANFNPEIIDRFLMIIGMLPVKQIKNITVKIRDEKWVYLMRNFRKTGYEFEESIKKLSEKKESKAILELAQAILTIKSKTEIAKKEIGCSMDNPFYIRDLNDSGIFKALANIEESYIEKALQITTGIMAEIIKLSKPNETKVFDYIDFFSLFDVDFFTLEIENQRSISYREDVKNLAATIKKLIERTIGKKCGDVDEAKRLFNYINNQLPSCRSMWRLRLFTLAQCPETFKEELKNAFFKLFEVENYYEIEGGTEYKKALKIAFPCLSNIDQRDYVAKVLQYFSEKAAQNPDQAWHKQTGWEILSSICNYLKDDELQKCEEKFGKKCNEKYKPKPSIGEVRGGTVQHKSPVNLNNFMIDQIVANLKTEWTAEKLNEQSKDDDFLNHCGVEGLGDALKEDIKKRTDDYLKNINDFFDRDNIHPHYLYSLLRGIEEMLRNKQSLNQEQVSQIFSLFEAIKNEGGKAPFKRKDDKSWLADWVTVHKVIADILLYILENKETKEQIRKEHREKIKNLISYLFTIKDSPSKEDEKPEYGEPYHIAINSVRGRAYEAFVVFTENDGKTLAKDIQEIYKKVLLDDSLAVRFVVGRYLASFYFRDKDFIVGLFPEIFPKDKPNKKDIYLATWEGYLSNTLYDKLFVELKDYYSHAITFDPKNYTQRKYSKGLDESLAIHLALAFAHLGLIISDPLFIQFWNTPNTTRHQEFISFIGRSCLTRDQAGNEWLKENKVSKEKLIKFWNWALENVSESKVLSGFGFWVNPNKEILDDKVVIEKIAETLEKSNGDIDWDYGLLMRLLVFADKNKKKTLEIVSNYLLDSNKNLNQNRRVPSMYQTEIKEALTIIYQNGNGSIKQEVNNLINTLMEEGNSKFWGLKEVISEDKI
ncbi:MAG: hypothetical protein PHG83_02520 [Patescibacteria group bacterium]|nr:hypothetical protein [Patescibacteria group bacterium]